MNNFSIIRRHAQEDSGATAVEYAIMLALIALAIAGTIASFGGSAAMLFDENNNRFESATETGDTQG